MQIRWQEDSLADLAALRAYIEEDNPAAAQKVARRIIAAVFSLPEHPLMGGPGRIHRTRELVIAKTPYTVVYHVTFEWITVLRVFHQARKWPIGL
jgi:toxin ParE1/3/4